MAVRIDGKAVAAKVRGEIAEEIAALKKQGVQTGMAVSYTHLMTRWNTW